MYARGKLVVIRACGADPAYDTAQCLDRAARRTLPVGTGMDERPATVGRIAELAISVRGRDG